MNLDEVQTRNFRAALAVASTLAEAERLAFAIWSESAGYIYANDGSNTSRSPGFDTHPNWPGILRRSLDLPHDRVGSNGRSTGILQQISGDVGGGWGDMAGTMVPAVAARRFLAELTVTDNPVYTGTLLTPKGSKRVDVALTSTAADVLRVQQPLADEAESSNYDESQVAIAKAIAASLYRTQPEEWSDMVTQQEFIDGLRTVKAEIVKETTAAVTEQFAAVNKKVDAVATDAKAARQNSAAAADRSAALRKELAAEDKETDATDAFLRDRLTVKSLVNNRNYGIDDMIGFLDNNAAAFEAADAARTAQVKALLEDIKAAVAPAPGPAPETPAV